MNKRWKTAGILGSVLVVSAGAGTLVYADDTSTEVTNDNSTASVLETADWGNMAAADVKTYANIRVEASEEADKAGVLPKGAAATVLGQESDWTKIVSGGIEGYVKATDVEFTVTEDKETQKLISEADNFDIKTLSKITSKISDSKMVIGI